MLSVFSSRGYRYHMYVHTCLTLPSPQRTASRIKTRVPEQNGATNGSLRTLGTSSLESEWALIWYVRSIYPETGCLLSCGTFFIVIVFYASPIIHFVAFIVANALYSIILSAVHSTVWIAYLCCRQFIAVITSASWYIKSKEQHKIISPRSQPILLMSCRYLTVHIYLCSNRGGMSPTPPQCPMRLNSRGVKFE